MNLRIGTLVTTIALFCWGVEVGNGDDAVLVNLRLYCDDREDSSFLEETDEIYLMGYFRCPDGKGGAIVGGPDDYRDGGNQERRRTYRIAQCHLKPGEKLTGKVAVLEDDKSIANDLLGALPRAVVNQGCVPDPHARHVGNRIVPAGGKAADDDPQVTQAGAGQWGLQS